MKRTQLIIATALLGGIVLSGCANSSNQKRDYNIVSFMYNNDAKEGVYKNVVVMNGQTIELPTDPNIENQVFGGWYTEETCENEYKRWGLEIDKDLTLYAKWSDYESSSLDDKVSRFHNVLENASNNVYKTVQECQATIMYPSLYDGAFYVNDKYIYNRYKDITVKDYYQIQDDKSELYYGQEQYSYDSRYFYDIYKDFEDSKNDTSNNSTFKEENIESFLSISYYNLFKAAGNNIVYYNNKGESSTFAFLYEFTGNYTKLAEVTNGTYEYKAQYVTSQYSDSVGTAVIEQYTYQYGLEIKNGKIKSASVDTEYIYALGEDDIQYYVKEVSTYDFYYGNGTYEDYAGTRF